VNQHSGSTANTAQGYAGKEQGNIGHIQTGRINYGCMNNPFLKRQWSCIGAVAQHRRFGTSSEKSAQCEYDQLNQDKSYMWLYRTSADANSPIVLYEYQPDRKAEHPKLFLKNFSGYLHADGYDGYHDLSGDIKVVGCFAHARQRAVSQAARIIKTRS
jgi:hypothetical protein